MTTDLTPDERDPRLNIGLLADLFRVLEDHGFRRPLDGTSARNIATGRAIVAVHTLARVFEGGER